MSGNTFYVFKDQYLLFNRWKPEETVFADSPNAIERMKNKLGNNTDKIFIVERSDSSLREKILKDFSGK